MNAEAIINQLKLTPHPEGGYFREMYRSTESVTEESLPDRYSGYRSISTAIYFLLKGDQMSAFHKLASDETWYYNLGDPVIVHMIHPDGTAGSTVVGPDIENGQVLQLTIPAGTWFGAKALEPTGYVLVSCSVAPGFDFKDFELAQRETLTSRFPQHSEIINELTPEP